MPEHKRIAVAMMATNLEINGISSVIMNYCSHINLSKFEITLLVGHDVAPIYRKKCEEIGIEILELPYRKKDTVAYYRQLFKCLKKKHYDIIHVHGSNSAMAVEFALAYLCKISVRIAHSHNTTCTSIKVHKMMLPFFNAIYTDAFACGKRAGQWLFGKKTFIVIPNGIITDRFRFKTSIRNEVRKINGLDGKYVLGHVGRLNDQKNQSFLLDVFDIFAEYREDAVLLLVGDGPQKGLIKEKVENHRFKDRVILYGETATPEKLYAAMDMFVFPSKYEGLPITLLEAQICGLPCIISNHITDEVVLSDRVFALSITERPEIWALKIASIALMDRESFYEENKEKIEKYSILNTVKVLENKYIEVFERELHNHSHIK